MQFKAGYILESVWNELKKLSKDETYDLKIKGLLENLTTFDALTTLNFNRPDDINSLLAVANNIITRGTPTLCSIFVEEEIANSIKQTSKEIEYGTIKFPFTNSNYNGEDFFNALHFILPNTEATVEQLNTTDLDSDFEKNFINSIIPSEHSYLKQLFQHQRQRKTLNDTVYRGRVDFCLEIPYINITHKLNRYNENVSIKGKKNIIVEIDGAAYHTDTIDDLRDFQINNMLNTVNRITESNLDKDVSKVIEILKNEEYIKIISKNYNSSVDTKLYTLLYTPLAIARIQKVIIEYFICNYDLLKAENKPLRIAIIEQDVPCAELAIKDLTYLFENLIALENKNTWLPKFELTVVASKAFENSPLKADNALQLLPISEHTKFDLVIDVSVFKREGIFNSDFIDNPNKITIRSSHFTLKETINTVSSANIIRYREIAKAINNEEHDIDKEAERILTYFIQNIFRKENFREGQLPILNRALAYKSVIGLLPTGGGKSLTYQLSALLQPGITIVVDPIRSLMKDQYDGLIEIGIDKCDFINSTLSSSQRTYIQIHELPFGQKQFVFLSPERFVIDEFRTAINSTIANKHYFAYCVIDEVHCVSEWGHDFRTPYLNLGINAQDICKTKTGDKVVLIGLTATASFDVLTDIERELQIGKTDGNAVVRYENTLRDELNYQIIETDITQISNINVNNGFQITENNWKKAVGNLKQSLIHRSINRCEEKITKFNDEKVLKEILEITFNQYLPKSQQSKFINIILKQSNITVDNYNVYSKEQKIIIEKQALEKFVSEMLPKLFIEWKPILQKYDEFNYGIIIFCPHKNGALGVNDVAAIKYSKEEVGTFVGSSDDDDAFRRRNNNQQTEDEISFKNLKFFKENSQSIMVATKAFGMGIDKPNIRFTYHINPPSSIESYVQEAGRAGRDKKVSISTIFYNRQWFLKKDNTLIYQGKVINNVSPIKNIFEPYNLDKDVLMYFFNNSFKGIDKEIVMINELLDNICSVKLTNKEHIERITSEKFEIEGVKISFGNLYLFIKVNNDDIGRIDYRNLALSNYNNDNFKKEILQNIASKIGTRREKLLVDNWLNEINEILLDYEGIEIKLNKLNFDDNITLLIPFENKYHSKIDRNNFPKRITENTLSSKYVDLLLKNQLFNTVQSSSISKTIFIENLLKALNDNYDFDKFIESFDFLQDDVIIKLKQETELKAFYYSPRSKSDTAKAVYRLNSLGIIDTYTINYQDKYYYVFARKKTDINHFDILEELFTRYTSQQRAKLLIQQVKEEQNGESIYKTCTITLTNFVYDLVAKKRKQAIDDMIQLCEISQNKNHKFENGEIFDLTSKENVHKQNLVIKEEIYYYFNAKYSRKDNEATVKENEVSENRIQISASLPDDFNKLNFEELVWKYIDLTDTDETGEFRTNIKHLRGSSQKMLRAYPEVPEFMVLKSFSLFILSQTTPNLLEDAKHEIIKAIEKQNLEGDELIDFIQKIISSIKKRYEGAEIEDALNEILSIAVLNNQLKKLISFNNKFSENYVNN